MTGPRGDTAMAVVPSNQPFGRKIMAIRPPPAWGWEQLSRALHPVEAVPPDQYWADGQRLRTIPAVRHIGLADLRAALRLGIEDFAAFRTDVLFLCVIYPVVGLVFSRAASGYHLLPLIFPLASGFALVGPFAAVGLNEMSRRREQNLSTTWSDNFAVLHSPALGSILLLGLLLITLLAAWLIAAEVIYDATLGPDAPVSLAVFVGDVLTTAPGWTMIVVGCGVGFLFALLVLTISAVAFPMMLDRYVTVDVAIKTSVRVATENKAAMAAWGLIVAGLLVAGSIPALLGLIVVMPVLGHATWHLYRVAVPR
jgi:uncharacterized membrane protein